jgi:hypothetical protein
MLKTTKSPILTALLIGLLSFHQPAPASAQTGDQPAPATGQVETPEVDNTPPAAAPLLTGFVHKSDWTPEERAAILRAQALAKLQSHQPLTAEDFRNLEVGCIGLDTVRPYQQKKAHVERVYPGLPAALAGIKVGDVIVDSDAESDDAKVVDPSITRWSFSCGIAGETYDVTVHRHGRPITFHLIEMNMEDIPDPTYRHQIEQLVQETGYPAHDVPIAQPDFYSAPKPTASTSTAKFIFGLLGL